MIPDLDSLFDQWFENGLNFIIGGFIEWLRTLLFESLQSFYNFNPIDLNAVWWRSNYAFALYIGVMIAAIIGVIKAPIELYYGRRRSAVASALAFVRVVVVGAFIPMFFGIGLEFSEALREGARFGYSDADIALQLALFEGLDLWANILMLPFIAAIGLWTWMAVIGFQLFTYLVALGGGLFYGLRDLSMGEQMWRRMLTLMAVTLGAPPIMTAITSIGFMVSQNIEIVGTFQTLNPGVFVFIFFQLLAFWFPFWMSKNVRPIIDARIKGGNLDNSGQGQTTIQRGNIAKMLGTGTGLYSEHRLDVVTADHRRSGSSSGGASAIVGGAVSAAHPVLGTAIAAGGALVHRTQRRDDDSS